mmetsp:Transcript_20549/g.48368  ORF Transcript_20549/g.48368 Transcript_20549/m.48368 type:complete len:228 (-) Transcript_20549:61-744(-)
MADAVPVALDSSTTAPETVARDLSHAIPQRTRATPEALGRPPRQVLECSLQARRLAKGRKAHRPCRNRLWFRPQLFERCRLRTEFRSEPRRHPRPVQDRPVARRHQARRHRNFRPGEFHAAAERRVVRGSVAGPVLSAAAGRSARAGDPALHPGNRPPRIRGQDRGGMGSTQGAPRNCKADPAWSVMPLPTLAWTERQARAIVVSDPILPRIFNGFQLLDEFLFLLR